MGDRVKPTFKIIEESDDFDYDGFAEDYMDLTNSKQELMEKYGLSKGQYYNRIKWVKSFTGFSRKIKDPDMKYIRVDNDKYRVQNKGRYCGVYSDLKTAQMVRDILIKHNWKDKMVKECIKLYSSARTNKWNNQYKGSPAKKEALSRFGEFRKLYESNKYTGVEIRDKMGFTEHQYRVCRQRMKEINPVRKQLVRTYDRVM